MKEATLVRDINDARGTLGTLTCEEFECKTVELPWRDNAHNISCVPTGTYICKIVPATVTTSIPGKAYELQDVPNRDGICIHVANYPSNVKGCIGLGMSAICNPTTFMVTNSVATVKKFYEFMANEDFELTII